MPKRFRLTCRLPVAKTEDGDRHLRSFATQTGLHESEALPLRFENFDSVINAENLKHRSRLFNADLDERKR